MNNKLIFKDFQFSPVILRRRIWLKSTDIFQALNYKRTIYFHKKFIKHKEIFSSSQVQRLVSISPYLSDNTIFSLSGAYLLCTFLNTSRASDFKLWLVNTLDREVANLPIKKKPKYHYPIETADPHDRKFGNDWLTPRKILDERNSAPEQDLIEQLESDGFDVTGAKVRIYAMYDIARMSIHMQETLAESRIILHRFEDSFRWGSEERGMNVCFTGKDKGKAYGGYPRRSLRK
ncbi:hypothetical protein [Serratia ureilytica]|uniref:hypothetical protein n=1 Tax=Serratia ureilytica TaxID=300181 RepID=UPI00235F1A5F|nr:hypothetical protein [Serratia ureilytica]